MEKAFLHKLCVCRCLEFDTSAEVSNSVHYLSEKYYLFLDISVTSEAFLKMLCTINSSLLNVNSKYVFVKELSCDFGIEHIIIFHCT